MNIRINEELQAFVDPLTANEYVALERSILEEGCRDPLVLWGDVLIDGHNRYAICQKHGIEFKIVQNDRFGSIEDVMLWMIDNQLARRSVTDFQRGMLALRKKSILVDRAKAQEESKQEAEAAAAPAQASEQSPSQPILHTREDIARIAGISSNAVSRIEKIQKSAAPELVEAVRSGTISINAAAAVATLPVEAQVAAVAAGKQELKQVAKQVRESKSPPKAAKVENRAEIKMEVPAPQAEAATLAARIDELTAENTVLKARIAELEAALQEAKRAA